MSEETKRVLEGLVLLIEAHKDEMDNPDRIKKAKQKAINEITGGGARLPTTSELNLVNEIGAAYHIGYLSALFNVKEIITKEISTNDK
jgi:hypothetical protein